MESEIAKLELELVNLSAQNAKSINGALPSATIAAICLGVAGKKQ